MSKTVGPHTFSTVYLILYNSFQTVLWAYIIFISVFTYLENEVMFWELVSPYVMLAVGLGWMESLHAVLGLVKGTPASAAIQSFGRSHSLLIPYTFYSAQRNYPLVYLGSFTKIEATVKVPVLPILFVVWGLSEIIRYPWYTLTSLGLCPKFLTWLRYSAFIILYPIGILGELGGYWAAWSQIESYAGYDFQLSIGESQITLFKFHYWVIFGLLILYPLGGPYLYMYMLKQRSKKLVKSHLS